MKSKFQGFYSTSKDSLKEIWLSEATLFVFDTNCLLNLYRCEDHTREDILGVMKEISSKVWIPFQVGFEYQRNRRTVIEDSINSLNDIRTELQNIYTQNKLDAGNVKKHLYNSLNDEIVDLQNQIKEPIIKYIENKINPRIQSKEEISKHDFIRDNLDAIIGDNVGLIPTQEEVDIINSKGENRYSRKQAPGFKDAAKKDTSYFSGVEFQDKFGDLYLWMEIINKSKEPDIKNVIFVCDDNKNDWWFKKSGRTHGVLESLKTEILKESNIDSFMLINQLTFLSESKDHLNNVTVSESSLKEVKELTYASLLKLSHNEIRKSLSKSLSESFDRVSNKYFINTDNPSYDFTNYFYIITNIRKQNRDTDVIISQFKEVFEMFDSNDHRIIEAMGETYFIQHREMFKEYLINAQSITDKINELMNDISIKNTEALAELEFLSNQYQHLAGKILPHLSAVKDIIRKLEG